MFFKGGRAAKWCENVFRQEVDTSVFPIQTWGDFEQQFRLHFFLVNAEVDTINALEGTSYHQGNRTVDDYLDSFQALVSNAGYMDPQTVVVKFRRGLRLSIQNQIATMPYRRPADTDPDAWYKAARRIDQARLANEVFQSVSHSTPSASLRTVSARPPPLPMARLPLAPPWSPVNKFTVLTIEDPNTINSKLVNASPLSPSSRLHSADPSGRKDCPSSFQSALWTREGLPYSCQWKSEL